MAKVKKSKKLNTSLDDEIPADLIPEEAIKDDVIVEEVEAGGEGDDMMSYTMGKIEAEDSEDDEKEEFDKAAKTVTGNNDTEEEDAEWVEDEEFNAKDEDFFLDEEDYDPDDPEDSY